MFHYRYVSFASSTNKIFSPIELCVSFSIVDPWYTFARIDCEILLAVLSLLVTIMKGRMDQISIKIPNRKCRLYLCLIEFIDLRYSQSCWYFPPLLWTSAPLTFSLPPSPLPCVNKYPGVFIHTMCDREGGGIGGLRQINTCRQEPLLVNSRRFHCRRGGPWPEWLMPNENCCAITLKLMLYIRQITDNLLCIYSSQYMSSTMYFLYLQPAPLPPTPFPSTVLGIGRKDSDF